MITKDEGEFEVAKVFWVEGGEAAPLHEFVEGDDGGAFGREGLGRQDGGRRRTHLPQLLLKLHH